MSGLIVKDMNNELSDDLLILIVLITVMILI
jgi:hypothetical protein